MELFGLSPIELVVIVVVAILVFGQRLPQVAGEAAATLSKFKRSLTDLRRETGIDQEIYKAKREFEEASRQARAADVPGQIRRGIQEAREQVRDALKTGDELEPPSAPPPPRKAELPPALLPPPPKAPDPDEPTTPPASAEA